MGNSWPRLVPQINQCCLAIFCCHFNVLLASIWLGLVVTKLSENVRLRRASCVFMPIVSSWDHWTSVSGCVCIQNSAHWLFTGHVVNCVSKHPNFLFLSQTALVNHKWVCIGDFAHLSVERVGKVFLYFSYTVSSSRVSNYAYLVKSWILYISLPNKSTVILHSLTVRDSNTRLWISIQIRIHDQHSNLLVSAHINKRQHGAKLKIFIDANRSSPNSCSHTACSLYQNQSSFASISFSLSLATLVVLRSHFEVVSHKYVGFGHVVEFRV